MGACILLNSSSCGFTFFWMANLLLRYFVQCLSRVQGQTFFVCAHWIWSSFSYICEAVDWTFLTSHEVCLSLFNDNCSATVSSYISLMHVLPNQLTSWPGVILWHTTRYITCFRTISYDDEFDTSKVTMQCARSDTTKLCRILYSNCNLADLKKLNLHRDYPNEGQPTQNPAVSAAVPEVCTLAYQTRDKSHYITTLAAACTASGVGLNLPHRISKSGAPSSVHSLALVTYVQTCPACIWP